jgi:predicted metal-binding membrane protein
MGLLHGVQCIGCCWALMALLFAFGVMNLVWVAALAVFVFIEKLTPAGALVGRIGGFMMIGAGLTIIAIGA